MPISAVFESGRAMRFSTTTIVPLAIVVVLGLLAGGIDLGNRLAAQEKTAGEVSTESGKPDDKSANKAEAVDDSSEEKPAEEDGEHPEGSTPASG